MGGPQRRVLAWSDHPRQRPAPVATGPGAGNDRHPGHGGRVHLGQVGLAGEVRPVPFDTRRREEADRLGVKTLIASESGLRVSSALILAGLGVVT